MASLPPSQQQQRRASPLQRTSSGDEVSRPLSVESSTISEDSQTVLLSKPSKLSEESLPLEEKQSERPSLPKRKDTNDLRKCWICFADESEDTPMSSEWRSPCPCALTAHEACLLDWIADVEAPNRTRGRPNKIECPQCKSEIVVARPKSYVVEAVRKVEDMCGRAILPGIMVLSLGSVWRLCYEYGFLTVEVVFGTEDAARILSPLFKIPSPHEGTWEALGHYLRDTWRINTGLAFIPPILILSRTSVADGILPILPMLFFATSPAQDPLADFGVWPPSAALSFATLPYIRSAYNFYYEQVWGAKERKWLKEIQPRSSSTGTEGEENQEQNNDDFLDVDENILEINFGPVDEQDLLNHNENQNQGAPAPPLEVPGADAATQNAQPQAQPQQHEQQQQQPPAAADVPADIQRQERNIRVSTARLADTVLGALAFPIVSALMGDLLRLVLPRSWTTLPPTPFWRSPRPTGFLQSRWARSIVGGCAFVVAKDAVMLYVRWKMAQNHRRRQVLDYDKEKKRVVHR